MKLEDPEYNKDVLATLKHCITGKTVKHVLKRVDEDDNCWRTSDDNSPIAYEWDVIDWEYVG